MRAQACRAGVAGASWRHIHVVRYACVLQCGCGNPRATAVHSFAGGESAARSGGHRARVMRVSVIVMIVVDHGVVDTRVAYVDVVNVAKTCVIPGMERFAPAQRKPSDAAAKSEAKPHAHSEAPAEESDERRTIIR